MPNNRLQSRYDSTTSMYSIYIVGNLETSLTGEKFSKSGSVLVLVDLSSVRVHSTTQILCI